jgi:predicted nucleic acid-binding protein
LVHWLVRAWRAGAFDLVISDFVINELTRTWAHLAPRLKASTDDLADFSDAIGLRAELLRIDDTMLACAGPAGLRDPDDLPVLALLIGSGADHLVTGDKDLLALAGTCPVLTVAGFVARFVP